MLSKSKTCKGVFGGLIVGKKGKEDGLYSAIEKGECKILTYMEQSELPELMKLEKEVAHAFIQAEILQIRNQNIEAVMKKQFEDNS